MKTKVDYFEKVIKVLKELKEDHPDVEITKHLMLATDSSLNLSDKELFQLLQRHQGELDMNTLSDKDLQRVIEDTEELFQETDYDRDLDDEVAPDDDGWDDDRF
jgi:hypothetical protein